MNKLMTTVSSAAALLVFPAISGAQTLNVAGPSAAPSYRPLDAVSAPAFSLRRGTTRETWHTVMLISGIILLIGLVDDDSALIILGGAGVLVSLSETNGMAYRSVGRGFDLLSMGPVSVGFSPLNPMALRQGSLRPDPSLVVQAKFKF